MSLQIITVLVACLTICGAQNEEFRVVTIAQGPVRGYKSSDSEVFQFFGIPYATAPTGVDKFKAPLPAPRWTETFEAVQSTIGCPVFPILGAGLLIQEDCLVANVLIPNTQETNLPVVVYIHGGAYALGFGMEFTPKQLVESQKVVAVTFNYRLGAHGFLCLGTEDIPGNAGLKDMLAVLRWVKENIASFGGNPDDITLAGYSAGASAADLLSLSKAAEGLFGKLILDSGVHVAAWNVQIEPVKNAQNYAQKLNFSDVGNLNALEEFYTTISYDLLLSDLSALSSTNSDFGFAPCIENDLELERIIEFSPVNIINSNEYTKLPVLYGFANMEGIFRLPQFDVWAPLMNERFSEFLLLDLDFSDEEEKEAVAQTVKEFYFGNDAVGLYRLFDYIDYFTDVMFAYPILRSIKLQTENGNDRIFLYQYSFYKIYNDIPGVPNVLVNFPGAFHCAQTEAILDKTRGQSDPENYTEEYRQIRTHLRELWVNFITTGAPVPEGSSFPTWPPANASRSPHMEIGDTIELRYALNERRAQFWDDIYDRHYRHPMPPVFEEFENEPDSAGIVSGGIILNLVFVLLIRLLNV